jgi:hypothetical protein
MSSSDCYEQKSLGDQLFSDFKYEKALQTYKRAIECFEEMIDYTRPPRTPKTKHMISEFIREIQNKIKVVERLIRSKNKRSVRDEYKIEDLKKYSEEQWSELPLYDIIRISDVYAIPISHNETNLDHMKYKFYQDFTSKYHPELKNLQELELIATIMITEGKYDDVLGLLNLSPTLNEIIEKNVLDRIYQVSLERMEKFTKHLGDDIIYAIDKCSYVIKVTKGQKSEIKKTLFDLFKKELEKLEFIFYKGHVYRVKKLSVDEIKKIIRSLNVYLRQLIEGKTSVMGLVSFKNDEECIYQEVLPIRFFDKTLENIDRMLNQNQNYISLIKK